MICCLLALLVAIPGVPMMRRRINVSHARQGHCPVHDGHGLGRDLIRSIAASSVLVALIASALTIHMRSHDVVGHVLGPICSALDRVVSSR